MIHILEEMQGAQTIAISGHIRPDGDCAGSCLGMARFLRNALPACRVDVFLGTIPASVERNLAGAETVNHTYETDVEHYDLFICLDCVPERLGEAETIFHKAARTVNIDHHQTNPANTADVNYVVPEASSASELVYHAIDPDGSGAPYMDEGVARNLYIGMVTDTGSFKFSNTSRATMEIAGRLMDYGFDHTAIIREVFDERTYPQQLLLGRALSDSARAADGKCIYAVADKQVMDLYGAQSSDTDGLANQLLQTEGCVCGVYMYELRPGCWKVSMRSTEVIDVADVCAVFGGGGHSRAAGCTQEGDRDQILNGYLREIENRLK